MGLLVSSSHGRLHSSIYTLTLAYNVINSNTVEICLDGRTTHLYEAFSAQDVYGTWHAFAGSADTLACLGPNNFVSTTNDGSGYTLYFHANGAPGSILHSVSGDKGLLENLTDDAWYDANGNRQDRKPNGSATEWYDAISSTTPVLSRTWGVSGARDDYSYLDASGVSQHVYVNYSAKTQKTNFACAGISDIPATATYLPSSISLPDGSSYSFTYEATPGTPADVTGRIAQITLPNGATIAYQYQGAHNGIDCVTGTPPTLTRTTSLGTKTYTVGQVTDEAGNVTSYNFNGTYETQRIVKQGSSTTLATFVTCYNGNFANCSTAAVAAPITQKDSYVQLPSGLTSLTEVQYNSNGLPTVTKTYDYGVTLGAPPVPSPVYTTTVTYAVLTNFIVDRPSSVVTTDAAGNVIAKTTYAYDGTGVIATPSPSPQHTNPSSGSRGNATTVSNFKTPTVSLDSTFTYWDTGLVKTATDPKGSVTSFDYPNATGTCGNSFPTKTNLPLSLSRSMTYNCNVARLATLTDENGQPASTLSYSDPLLRLTQSTDALGNNTNNTYTSTTADSSMTFNAGTSVSDILTTVGSSGYIINQKRRSPSGQYDSVQTDVSIVGNTFKTRSSVPYIANAGVTSPTGGSTQTIDALGRPLVVTDAAGGIVTKTYTNNDMLTVLSPAPAGEVTKKTQTEYDGLGRVTSICLITTLTGNAPCGQGVAQNGYKISFAYDDTTLGGVRVTRKTITQGVQTRTYLYDLLGRLRQSTDPEQGTILNVYDSTVSPCANSAGDFVKSTDNAGNIACLFYDALHRNTSRTYPSGPNSANSQTKTFVYDSTPMACPTGSNVLGRLGEAYTAGGATNVDTAFCYSARGEVTDTYQATSHSAGGVYLTATYWADRALHTLSGLPGLPTLTYGVDGAGRISTVLANSGQNPVTSSSRNVFGEVNSATYGSLDSDTFTYSSNMGRMASYATTVNTTNTVSGTLSRTLYGNVTKNIIVDPLNTVNSQTCNYVYDDLNRLGSVDCGSKWGQTFTYDQYGNVTMAGSQIWAPGYDSATNRYTLAGVVYDANGYITTGPLGTTYAYDSSGKTTGINSNTYTYDALGRWVESHVGAAYTQMVYSPTGGKLATMSNSTTPLKTFIGLPGGGQAVYSGTSLSYYRHSDWQGSSRLATTAARGLYFSTGYAPFGSSYGTSGTTDKKFAGNAQDLFPADGNTYDTPNRLFAGNQARWYVPDPAGIGMNRYVYVNNNPVNGTDTSGMDWNSGLTRDGRINNGVVMYGGLGGGGGALTIAEELQGYLQQVDNGYQNLVKAQSAGAAAMKAAHNRMDAELDNMAAAEAVGMPASVQIVRFLFEYKGPDPGLAAGLPAGTMIDVNVYLEHVVDANGNPVQGKFQVNEQLQQMQPNNVSPSVPGPMGQGGGTFVDNIGFTNPSGTLYNWERQTFSVTYPNGTTIPLTTVINQFAIYQNGVLIVANPAIAIP